MALQAVDLRSPLLKDDLDQPAPPEIVRRDEAAVIELIDPRLIHHYVYEIEVWSQADKRYLRQQALTQDGAVTVAQAMGGITCGSPIWTIDERGVTCSIPATDEENQVTVWGVGHSPWSNKGKDGREFENRYAHAQALGRAQRNALVRLIPASIADALLDLYREAAVGRQRNPAERSPRSRAADGEPQPRRQRPVAGPAEQTTASRAGNDPTAAILQEIQQATDQTTLNRSIRAKIAGLDLRDKTTLWQAFHQRMKEVR